MNAKKFSTAGLLAISLSMGAVGTACLAAAPAVAAPTANPSPAVNPSTINPNGTFELNITKYLGASTNQTNDGTKQTISGRDILQGVPFDIYQVQGVDLTTNEGWAAATALQGHTITAAEIKAGQLTDAAGKTYAITKVSTVVTDATGNATYDGKAGLYLMNENLSGATVTDVTTGKNVPTNSITQSVPALVTLPMTNPSDTSQWMDTVYVYPKNQSDQIVKSVDDKQTVTSDQASTGDKVSQYTLTGSITPGLTGSTMGSYVIIDQLDPRLQYKGIDSVVVKDAVGGDKTLVAGTDYKVSVIDADSTPGGEYVQVYMLQSGLDKIAAAKAEDAGATVVARMSTTILSEGNGDIPNTVSLLPNQSAVDQVRNNTPGDIPGNPGTPYTPPTTPPTDVPGIPSNKVDSKYGDLALTKVDGSDASKTLAGAQFSLYSTLQSSTTGDNQADCNAVTTSGTPIMTGITTDSTGKVTVKGLQESDFYDNGTQTDQIVYCLVETKAPTGYNLLAKAVPFTINQVESAGAVALTVKDEQHNLANSLPLTGGSGAAALGVGGLVLLGGGAALVIARRRRDDEDLADELV